MAFMKNIVKRWKGLVSGNPVYINKKQWIRRGAALITGEGILFILTHICYEDIRFLLLLQLLLFPGAAAYKKREERRKRKQYKVCDDFRAGGVFHGECMSGSGQ